MAPASWPGITTLVCAAQPDNTLSPLGYATQIVGTHMRSGELVHSDALATVNSFVRCSSFPPYPLCRVHVLGFWPYSSGVLGLLVSTPLGPVAGMPKLHLPEVDSGAQSTTLAGTRRCASCLGL